MGNHNNTGTLLILGETAVKAVVGEALDVMCKKRSSSLEEEKGFFDPRIDLRGFPNTARREAVKRTGDTVKFGTPKKSTKGSRPQF